MTTFHVQIFFYGLIAFANRDGITHALLMQQDPHLPFLVFDGGACSGDCTSITIDNVPWTGWQLATEQIEIPPLTLNGGSTGGVKVEQPAGHRRPGTHAPSTKQEAEDSAWLTQMSDLFGGSVDFNEGCLQQDDLTQCGRVTLAGRISLQVSPLKTCSIVSAQAGCNQTGVLDGINEYAFFPSISAAPPQALVDVAVLVADVTVNADTLTVQAYKSGRKPSRKVMLKGRSCDADKQCIDLFLGNIVSKRTGRCPDRRLGDDFRHYYELFVTKPLPPKQAIPIADGFSFPATLEPDCSQLPLPPPPEGAAKRSRSLRSKRWHRAKPQDMRAFDFFLESAASRPVCTMTVF